MKDEFVLAVVPLPVWEDENRPADETPPVYRTLRTRIQYLDERVLDEVGVVVDTFYPRRYLAAALPLLWQRPLAVMEFKVRGTLYLASGGFSDEVAWQYKPLLALQISDICSAPMRRGEAE